MNISIQTAMPWLRRLITSLTPWKSSFDPKSVHMTLVDKVALVHVFLQELQFFPSTSFHQCSTLISIYMLLLPERQMGKAWGPSKM
jgi:hypothetical protein